MASRQRRVRRPQRKAAKASMNSSTRADSRAPWRKRGSPPSSSCRRRQTSGLYLWVVTAVDRYSKGRCMWHSFRPCQKAMFCSWLQQNGSEGRILSPAPRQGLLQKERNVLIPAAASLLRRANSVPHMAPIQGFRCEKEQHKHKANPIFYEKQYFPGLSRAFPPSRTFPGPFPDLF